MLLTVTLTLLEGLGTTLKLFALTLLFALPLGLVIALGAMSRIAPLRWLVSTVVWVVRGTPLMIQILILFYGPGLLFDLPLLPRFGAALLSFVINYACYFSEIYRGGIQSIPRGQYEAGEVLGMTRSQIFFKVTLLQVVKRIVPPMGNEFITLVKDTSLIFCLGLHELLQNATNLVNTYADFTPYLYCAVFYLILTTIPTILIRRLEKRFNFQ